MKVHPADDLNVLSPRNSPHEGTFDVGPKSEFRRQIQITGRDLKSHESLYNFFITTNSIDESGSLLPQTDRLTSQVQGELSRKDNVGTRSTLSNFTGQIVGAGAPARYCHDFGYKASNAALWEIDEAVGKDYIEVREENPFEVLAKKHDDRPFLELRRSLHLIKA
jgi:hypothetical protein